MTNATTKRPFFEILPSGKWVFAFDNHTMSWWMECEQQGAYRYVNKIVPKGDGMGFKAQIGIWWSEVMSRYYESAKLGKLLSGAELSAEAALLWREYDWKSAELQKTFMRFCEQEFASFGKDNEGNEISIPVGPLKMASQYADFASEDCHYWKVLATESSFTDVFVGATNKVMVYFTGRPDLVALRLSDNKIYPWDHKTSDEVHNTKFLNKWKPNHQIQGYAFAVRQLVQELDLGVCGDRVIINGAARLDVTEKKSGEKKPRFIRLEPQFTVDELEEWRFQITLKAERVREAIESGHFVMNDKSCDKYYGCIYRDLCKQTPAARQLLIETLYQIKEPWSHLDED